MLHRVVRLSNDTEVAPVVLEVSPGGGLDQQRTIMTTAALFAWGCNIPMLMPKLRMHSAWMDKSSFDDLYDTPHFVTSMLHEHGVSIITHVRGKMKRFRADSKNTWSTFMTLCSEASAWASHSNLTINLHLTYLAATRHIWDDGATSALMPRGSALTLKDRWTAICFGALRFHPEIGQGQ